MLDERIGYMCGTAWDHELGVALGGNTIYASIEDLLTNEICAAECGVVEVRIKLKERITTSDFSIKRTKNIVYIPLTKMVKGRYSC